MRRATFFLSLGLAVAVCALPQEPASNTEAKQETEQHDPWIWWKWANFAILAGGLGYLVSKHAPGLFAQRAREIQQGMLEAAQVKKDAEGRAAQIEQRLAGLKSEIENLRNTARTEMAAEGERITRETERHLRRIQEQSEQELDLMARAAREELRKYSAKLALDLAEERIRSRMTPDVEERLMDAFLHDLRYRVTQNVRI